MVGLIPASASATGGPNYEAFGGDFKHRYGRNLTGR